MSSPLDSKGCGTRAEGAPPALMVTCDLEDSSFFNYLAVAEAVSRSRALVSCQNGCANTSARDVDKLVEQLTQGLLKHLEEG